MPMRLATEYHVRFLPESPRPSGWVYVSVGTPGNEQSLGHHHGGPAAMRAAAAHLLALANKLDQDRTAGTTPVYDITRRPEHA